MQMAFSNVSKALTLIKLMKGAMGPNLRVVIIIRRRPVMSREANTILIHL
jgi:hypothetical protein